MYGKNSILCKKKILSQKGDEFIPFNHNVYILTEAAMYIGISGALAIKKS